MASFKAYFKKEILESIRQSRYIIFLAGFVLWAILNPLTLKLLPNILGDQIPQELLDQMIPDRAGAIQNYIGDIFTISLFCVIFPLMGILSDEIGRQKLMLPFSKGLSAPGLVLAKSVHYNIVVSLMVLVGLLVNYQYTGILFEGTVAFADLMSTAVMIMLYFCFIVSLLIFISSLFRRGIISGLLTLVAVYTMSGLAAIDRIGRFLPHRLLQRATDIGNVFSGEYLPALATTIALIIFLNILSIYRMKTVEVV